MSTNNNNTRKKHVKSRNNDFFRKIKLHNYMNRIYFVQKKIRVQED